MSDCCLWRDVANIFPAPSFRAAAMAVSPIVPEPTTATVSPPFNPPMRTPCTETARGSTRAPSAQVIESPNL